MLGGFSGVWNAWLFSWINESSSGDNLFLSIDESNRNLKEKTKEKTFKNFKKQSDISSELNKYYNGLKWTKINVFKESDDTFWDLKKVAERSFWWPTYLAKIISDEVVWFKQNENAFLEAWVIAREFYYQKSIESEENAKSAYDIGSIWLYSNGSLDDSPFDLIADIEAINEVILWKWDLYEWDRKADGISPELRDFIDTVDENPFKAKANNEIKETETVIIPPKLQEELKKNWAVKLVKQRSSNICLVDNSGLSENSLRIAKWLENTDKENFRDLEEDINSIKKVVKEDYNENVDKDKNFTEDWWYSPVSDEWWCEEGQIICVKVEFLGYEQEVFWKASNSIDKVITNANKHLRKWAFSSKIQADMAINNFELNLKNLDLTTIFSWWVIIEYKPIPLLNLNNWKNQTIGWNKYESKQILKKTFDSIWIDWKRENDLTNLLNSDEIQVSTQQYKWESITAYSEAEKFLKQESEKKEKQLDIISVNVNNAVKSAWNNEDLNNQLIEIKTFISRIADYSYTLEAVSKKLNEKPVK